MTTTGSKRSAGIAAGRAAAGLAPLAWTAAAFTYALVVLGGVVRITDSGMACGEDWPLCKGRLFPTLDLPTLLEWGHRVAALGVSLLVAGLAAYAWARRRRPGVGGPGGVARPTGLALGILLAQVALGAVTVRWQTPAAVVSLHLVTAMLLLAALLVAAARATPALAGPYGSGPGLDLRAARAAAGASSGAAVLGLVVVALGAVVANTGAGPLCRGFPLCNGQWWPEGGGLVHLHWAHRLAAYLLALHVWGAAAALRRQPAPAPVRATAAAAALALALQVATAAALVLHPRFPTGLRALHLAAGAAAWGALVLWAFAARRATAAVTTSGRA
jgi:cytochrome c oxidase assembly protein subunit 15